MLINQFCAAVRAWAQKAEEQGISMRVAAYVGGPIVYAPETIEEMKKRLEMVVESIDMAEDFLIVSLIHAIERDFEDRSENYAKGIQRIRLANERILSRVPENLQASPQAQHMLRHSLARRMLKNGAQLPEVQRFLGHTRLSPLASISPPVRTIYGQLLAGQGYRSSEGKKRRSRLNSANRLYRKGDLDGSTASGSDYLCVAPSNVVS